jgi:hypothetical protein
VSVADGGTNAIDNLVTACRHCNAGKAARSLQNAPTSIQVIERIDERTANLQQQAEAMKRASKAEKKLTQSAVNLKCQAYGVKKIIMVQGEQHHIIALCQAYGADKVLQWYEAAVRHDIPEDCAIKYVYGIIRRQKDDGRIK